jgi:hypothetical protein
MTVPCQKYFLESLTILITISYFLPLFEAALDCLTMLR